MTATPPAPSNPDSALPYAVRGVRIQNFRGIRNLNLSFMGLGEEGPPNRLVVLAGPNGCGKTRVLEAILIALRWPELVRNPDQPFGKDTLIVTNIDSPLQKRINLTATRSSQLADVLGERESPSEVRQRMALNVPVAYFSSWRTPKLVGPVGTTIQPEAAPDVWPESDRLRIVKQYLVDARAHEALSTQAGPRLYSHMIEKLDEVWKTLRPGTTGHFEAQPASKTDPRKGFDLFLVDGDHEPIPLDALSAGELEIIQLVGWTFATGFESGIILIDEPELHLDAQWHRVVIRTLQKLHPTSQIIVATHSEEIYDAAMSFERVLLLPADDPRRRLFQGERQDRAS